MLAGPAKMKTWIGPAWTGSGSGFIDEFDTPTQVSISSASVRLCTRTKRVRGFSQFYVRETSLGAQVAYYVGRKGRRRTGIL